MFKRERPRGGLRSPVVLWAGAGVREFTKAFVVRNDKTQRTWTLRSPPGTVALVAGAYTEEEAVDSHAEILSQIDAFEAPAPAPCQPPAVFTESMLERSKLSPELVDALQRGLVPADPDPPNCAVNVEELQGVLDTTSDHHPAPAGPVITDYAAYELPPDTPNRYLERVNGFERDRRLRFEENTHTYFVRQEDGTEKPTNGSVTYLAHKYEVEFNKEQASEKLIRSKNWPRVRYSVSPWHVAQAFDFKERDCVAFVDRSGDILDTVEIDLGRFRTDADFYVAVRPFTKAEILRSWELLALRASNRGTEIHFQIELFLNRDGCHSNSAEFASFASFAQRVMIPLGMVAFRTEWRVFCDVTSVAGSIDCVVRLPDGTFGIIDWKRSTKVRERLHRSGAPFEVSMKEPMDHLDGVVTAGYALQLNLYKYILEKQYDITVSCLILAQVDAEDDFYTFVPDLDLEASYIMAARAAENASPGTELHEQAERRMQEAHEQLLAGRMQWADMMPPRGIDVDGWKRGETRAVAIAQENAVSSSDCDRGGEILFHL